MSANTPSSSKSRRASRPSSGLMPRAAATAVAICLLSTQAVNATPAHLPILATSPDGTAVSNLDDLLPSLQGVVSAIARSETLIAISTFLTRWGRPLVALALFVFILGFIHSVRTSCSKPPSAAARNAALAAYRRKANAAVPRYTPLDMRQGGVDPKCLAERLARARSRAESKREKEISRFEQALAMSEEATPDEENNILRLPSWGEKGPLPLTVIVEEAEGSPGAMSPTSHRSLSPAFSRPGSPPTTHPHYVIPSCIASAYNVSSGGLGSHIASSMQQQRRTVNTQYV